MASFSDDFTGTAGALLRQRSGWSFSGTATYQDRGAISNNRAKCGGTAGLTLHYGYVRSVADTQQYVQAVFVRTGGISSSLYARWVSDQSFIALRSNATNVELIKRVAGTITAVASIAGFTAGDTLRLEMRGTTAKIFRNGSQIGTTGGYTISDSALQSSTTVGLGGEGSNGAQEYLDDIAGGGLTVTLAPAKGSHAGRGDAAGVALKLRLTAAKGRHASRGDATAVVLHVPVKAAKARQAVWSDAGRVSWRGRVTPQRAVQASRGDAAAVTLHIKVRPGKARQAVSSDVAGLVWRGRIWPADAAQPGRADASMVRWRAVLRPADGLAAVSSDAAVLRFVARATLAAADARSVVRGDTAGVGWRGRISPADVVQSTRADVAGLALRFRMMGARGVHALRADATSLAWRGVLRGADGWSAVHGAARVRRAIGVPGLVR